MKTFSGRRASQNPPEIRAFIDLLRAEGARRYLEVGARHGDTFHAVGCALSEAATLVAIDLPGGAWGRASSRSSLEAAVGDLMSRGRQATVIFGNSMDDAVVRQAAGLGPFDAVLIDGDHSYAGVGGDWSRYRGMARMVAFHDIVGEGCRDKQSGHPVEVPRLWREVKATGWRTVELVAPASRMGIGVVWPDEIDQ